jgi:myo-inositol-1(or 4)-monophosphatase
LSSASSTTRTSTSCSSPSAAAGDRERAPALGVGDPTLDKSLLATEFPYNIRETPDNNLKEYAAFSVRVRGVRRLGSAVLDLAWLSSGRLDGYWELRLGPWDVAAGSLLVEEASGRVTSLKGGALNLDSPSLVASNGRIHSEILDVLEEVRGGKP